MSLNCRSLKGAIVSAVIFLNVSSVSPLVDAAGLPPEAQRDVYVVTLAEHLKAEQWREAYPLFKKIEKLTQKHKLAPEIAVTFYRGEVAFHLRKYLEAQQYLTQYITKAGNQGAFYVKSLKLLSQVDAKAKELATTGLNLFAKGVDPKDFAKTFVKQESLYLKAAKLGSSWAQVTLGRIYLKGNIGVEQDIDKAVMWYKKAAAQGSTAALNKIAEAHLTGQIGMQKDAKKAMRLYMESAELGSGHAHLKIAQMYFRGGSGIPRNSAKAISWALKVVNKEGELANAKGISNSYVIRDAQYFLGQMNTAGPPKEHNLKKALKWYTLAANEARINSNKGCSGLDCAYSTKARFVLAGMYHEGNSVIKDLPRAKKLYQWIVKSAPNRTENYFLKLESKKKLKSMNENS